MTIPEQAGKVATSTIDALKANPSCLAAIVVMAMMSVLQYFEAERQGARMMERTKDVMQLLNRCYPNQGHP
jgi:hypothetical protein